MARTAILIALAGALFSPSASAADQPVAIFHAFDQSFADIARFVCVLADQGYSHIQIPPAQKSTTANGEWYDRYQPIDFNTIEGRGSANDLQHLTNIAHDCGVKVIADVVFNHMTSERHFGGLDKFPGLVPGNFHPQCPMPPSIFEDGNTEKEITCWLNGDLPDLKQEDKAVRDLEEGHLRRLLGLGIDGFRFDAAKHMEPRFVKEYIDFVDRESHGNTWNYLEVIEDHDTKLERYNGIAAVTDFRFYTTLTSAFRSDGDLRSLRVPSALDDSRSTTFGGNHDTRKGIGSHQQNDKAINPCDAGDVVDCYLADAYALARESGTPLVLNEDNLVRIVQAGVKFRQIMHQRAGEGRKVKENVLAVVDSRTLLTMERGEEGFFVVNKAADKFDIPVLDMTLSNLEGCYREIRNGFTVAIQRNTEGKKFVTRWGTSSRGGMEVHARDALYFIRDPLSSCAP
jgi:alpha-amylase